MLLSLSQHLMLACSSACPGGRACEGAAPLDCGGGLLVGGPYDLPKPENAGEASANTVELPAQGGEEAGVSVTLQTAKGRSPRTSGDRSEGCDL